MKTLLFTFEANYVRMIGFLTTPPQTCEEKKKDVSGVIIDSRERPALGSAFRRAWVATPSAEKGSFGTIEKLSRPSPFVYIYQSATFQVIRADLFIICITVEIAQKAGLPYDRRDPSTAVGCSAKGRL